MVINAPYGDTPRCAGRDGASAERRELLVVTAGSGRWICQRER